jgi:hypothetical protein
MSGTVLSTLFLLTLVILTPTLGGSYSNYAHFTDKKIEGN